MFLPGLATILGMSQIFGVEGQNNNLSDRIVLGNVELYDCKDTAYYTDGSPMNLGLCGQDKIFHQVNCHGRYCDNMQLKCCSMKIYGGKKAKAGKCFWKDTWFTDGTHISQFEWDRQSNQVMVSGMRCKGRYCDDHQFYYCNYPEVMMEEKHRSTFTVSDEDNWGGCLEGDALKKFSFSGSYGDDFSGQCHVLKDVSPCPIGPEGQACQECHNGVVQGTEECDEEDEEGCNECQWAACGDGIKQGDNFAKVRGKLYKEECDEAGKNLPENDCTPECKFNICGDGYLHKKEECEVGENCHECTLLPSVVRSEVINFQSMKVTWEMQKTQRQKITGYRLEILLANSHKKVNVAQDQLAIVGDGKLEAVITGIPAGLAMIARVQALTENVRRVQPDRWSVSNQFIMSCGCQESHSDLPSDVDVKFSVNSLSICPQWKDNSLCEGYFLLNKRIHGQDQFNQFASVVGSSNSCGNYVENTRKCEDLKTTRYKVNQKVEYCVEQESEPDLPQSVGQSCATFTVPWVASVRVSCVLGGTDTRIIPVTGYSVKVFVAGQLAATKDVRDVQGVEVINVQLPGGVSKKEEVFITAEKYSGSKKHDIRCLDKYNRASPCDEHKIRVDHLSVAQIQMQDFSTKQVEGELSYYGTEKYTKSNDAPVIGEQVCATELVSGEILCEETDGAGYYKFQLPVGLTYNIWVNSTYGHEYAVRDKTSDDKIRLEVTGEGILTGNNFVNLEQRLLTVEYMGGECNLPLEGGAFKFSPLEGNQFVAENVIDVVAGQTSKSVLVPATSYTITYVENNRQGVDVSFQSDINNYFSNTNNYRTANLTLANATSTFRYNSEIHFTVSVFGKKNDCGNHTDILHQNDEYQISFKLFQHYPKKGICRRLSNETTTVKFFDRLGYIDGGYCRESAEFENYENGCIPHMTWGPEAKAEVISVPGQPNLHHPYVKEFHLTTQQKHRTEDNSIREHIVLGQRANEFNKVAFGAPKWIPLLILRRPPGGKSFSEYTKTSTYTTTLSFGMTKTTKKNGFAGLAGPFKAIPAGKAKKESGTSACAGVCTEVSGNTQSKGISLDINTKDIEDKFDNTDTYISDSYTIRTSDSERSNSVGSDLFVLPNLLILLQETWFLELRLDENDEDFCEIQKRKDISWDSEPAKNADMLSLHSEYDIEKEIFRLKENLGELAKLPVEDVDLELNTTLAESVEGYENLLKMNNELKEQAYKNPTPLGLVGDETTETDANITEAVKNSNKIHFYGGGHSLTRKTTSASTQTAAFSFSATAAFRAEIGFGASKSRRDVGKVGGATAAINFLSTSTLSAVIGQQANFVLNIGSTESATHEVSTSFTLQDDDLDDEFLVEVYTDPVFGTPVFKTVAGTSKCSHEPNTTIREKMEMRFAPGQVQEINYIRQGEAGHLNLELVNLNMEGSYIDASITVDPRSNPDGLQVRLNGAYVNGEKGVDLNLYPGKLRVTLSVEQGNGFYYKGIELMLRSRCEPWQETITQRLKFDVSFLEECASLDWAGQLKSEKNFFVSSHPQHVGVPANLVPIKIMRSPLNDPFVEQQRLQSVEFQYRRAGATVWTTPLINEDGEDYPVEHKNKFYDAEKKISIEDDYGFAKMYWDTSLLLGGQYEIRVRAACSRDTGIESLDNHYSSIITGVVDRLPPRQFRAATPENGKFYPGQAFTLQFDEAIDCSRPYSYKAILTVDVLDLEYEFHSRNYESEKNDLTSYCYDNSIEISLTAVMNYAKIMGQYGDMTVCNVNDMHQNSMAECISWKFKFMEVDLTKITTGSELLISGDISDRFRRRRSNGVSHRFMRAFGLGDEDDDTETGTDAGGCFVSEELYEQVRKEISHVSEAPIENVKILCIRKVLKGSKHYTEENKDEMLEIIEFEIQSNNKITSLTAVHNLSQQLTRQVNQEGGAKILAHSSSILDHTMNAGSMPLRVSEIKPEDIIDSSIVKNEDKNMDENSPCVGPYAKHPTCETKMEFILQTWEHDVWYTSNGVDGTRCSIQEYLHRVETLRGNPVCPSTLLPDKEADDTDLSILPEECLAKEHSPCMVSNGCTKCSSVEKFQFCKVQYAICVSTPEGMAFMTNVVEKPITKINIMENDAAVAAVLKAHEVITTTTRISATERITTATSVTATATATAISVADKASDSATATSGFTFYQSMLVIMGVGIVCFALIVLFITLTVYKIIKRKQEMDDDRLLLDSLLNGDTHLNEDIEKTANISLS